MTLLEEAKEWLEANTPIRWTTDVTRIPEEAEFTLDELNRRPNKYANWMSAFASEQIAIATREKDEKLLQEIVANKKLSAEQYARGLYALDNPHAEDGYSEGYDACLRVVQQSLSKLSEGK